MEVPSLLPLYIVFVVLAVILYLVGAFILGVVSASLTLPVLYYTGYGLIPPHLTPANRDTGLSVAMGVHLGVGGLFAVLSVITTLFTGRIVSSLVRYRFARLSPRLETLPKLGLATGLVLVIWVGYLLYAREDFHGDTRGERRAVLLASIVAAIVFCICALSIAVLSTATRYI